MAQQPLLLQVICDFASVTHVPNNDTHLCETTRYRSISQLLARSLVSNVYGPSMREESRNLKRHLLTSVIFLHFVRHVRLIV